MLNFLMDFTKPVKLLGKQNASVIYFFIFVQALHDSFSKIQNLGQYFLAVMVTLVIIYVDILQHALSVFLQRCTDLLEFTRAFKRRPKGTLRSS